MSARLICLLSETPGAGVLTWALFPDAADNGARPRVGSGDWDGFLAELAGLGPQWAADGGRVVGVLPGEVCALRTMPAPPKAEKKFRAAAGLLLEDELAEPVDDVHVAIAAAGGEASSGDDAGGVAGDVGVVAAVKTALIAEWTEFFEEAGFSLDVLTVDFLCLKSDERAVLAAVKDRILWCNGARGFAADKELGGRLAEALTAPDAERFQFYGDKRLYAAHFEKSADYAGPADESFLLKRAAESLGVGIGGKAGPVNFLQGQFRRRTPLTIDLGAWRRVGALAAALAVAFFALSFAEGRRDGVLAAHYKSEAERLYQEKYPNAGTRDIRSHARATLASGGATSFADLSARLGVALGQSESVAVNRVLYDEDRGLYSFTIASETNGAIDAFRNQLAEAGLIADDASGYRRSGDFWVGEMTARLK